MRATGVCAAGLLSLHLLTTAALGQCCYYYPPRAPDMTGPGFYLSTNCGVTFGPNYVVRPPFQPFQGMLPAPTAPNGGVPGYTPAGSQCNWQMPPWMAGSYPYGGGHCAGGHCYPGAGGPGAMGLANGMNPWGPYGGMAPGGMAGGYPYGAGMAGGYPYGAGMMPGAGMVPGMYNGMNPAVLAGLCPPWMLPQGGLNDPMAASLAMSQLGTQRAMAALGQTPYAGMASGQMPYCPPGQAPYCPPGQMPYCPPGQAPMGYPAAVAPPPPTGLAALMPPAGWLGMPVPLPARPFVAQQEQEKQRQASNHNGVTAFPNHLFARSPRDFFMVEVDPRQRPHDYGLTSALLRTPPAAEPLPPAYDNRPQVEPPPPPAPAPVPPPPPARP